MFEQILNQEKRQEIIVELVKSLNVAGNHANAVDRAIEQYNRLVNLGVIYGELIREV